MKSGRCAEIPQHLWDEVLKGFTGLEVEVVRLRFGLGGGSALSVDKIAATLKITRERVRRIEAKALRILQKTLQERSP